MNDDACRMFTYGVSRAATNEFVSFAQLTVDYDCRRSCYSLVSFSVALDDFRALQFCKSQSDPLHAVRRLTFALEPTTPDQSVHVLLVRHRGGAGL